MPVQEIEWTWEEAFYKFGFEDGEGWNGTDLICNAIATDFPDLVFECDGWGCHNYMIFDIKKKDTDESVYTMTVVEPDGTEREVEPKIGYDSPRRYLPKYLIEFLDREFPE
jgi:hypothetical protein